MVKNSSTKNSVLRVFLIFILRRKEDCKGKEFYEVNIYLVRTIMTKISLQHFKGGIPTFNI